LPLIQLLTKALANGFFPGILAISQGIHPWLIAGFLVVNYLDVGSVQRRWEDRIYDPT
jgi:hypothetical protein